jgi:hypothetical protein
MSAVVVQEGKLFKATLGSTVAFGATENMARRTLGVMLESQTAAPPVVKAVAPPVVAVPVAPVASGFTPEEQAILALTGALKQEVQYYTSKKDGATRIGLPRAFSFNAQKRLRFMKPGERAAELGAWCLVRGLPNFFAALGTPTENQLASAKLYCKQGQTVPVQPKAPVSTVSAAPVSVPVAAPIAVQPDLAALMQMMAQMQQAIMALQSK